MSEELKKIFKSIFTLKMKISCESDLIYSEIIQIRNKYLMMEAGSRNRIKVALDVWDAGSPEPRGDGDSFLRLYAKACAHLAETGEISLAYTGTSADREWLLKAGLLEKGSFHLFRIPGRLQHGAAQLSFLPWGLLLGSPDIFHSSTLYPFRSGHMPVVGTLVDFVPTRLPEFVPIQFLMDQ